ncbi:MAG TPA: rhomboid family intramembrane serine protease [Candidatus Limnocylindria bacterium]|nr:rhomboid family intramembrane serine protease [Candidatus Limnocylindria bacterium]
MRVIGHIDNDKDARTFGDFLYVQGIENEAERDGNRWAIWVHADDQIPGATKLLNEFRTNPNDPKFLAGSPAEKLREQAKAKDTAYRKRVVDGRKVLPGLTSFGFGFVTYALIAASVAVFFLSKMGEDQERIAGLFISWEGGLREIRRGEIWRLVTPMLIHFGFAHILFNMLWIKDLGSVFEARLGSWYFILFVFVTSALSNFAEYSIGGHANFGGMSGVVYGLIGYVWTRGHFDPGAGLFLDRQSMIFALIWFVVCFTGWVGPVANWAHGGGLVIGMAWAFIDSKRK